MVPSPRRLMKAEKPKPSEMLLRLVDSTMPTHPLASMSSAVPKRPCTQARCGSRRIRPPVLPLPDESTAVTRPGPSSSFRWITSPVVRSVPAGGGPGGGGGGAGGGGGGGGGGG